MTTAQQTDTESWYRQFWPWFLIALPGAVVISSLAYVYLAVQNQDPVVDGNYYKHGLTINERLEDAKPTTANTDAAPADASKQPH